MNPIYLDHAAATPLHPAVLEAMLPYMAESYGNPSSIHTYGRKARAAMDDARESLAAGIGCRGRELIFTSGGTESDNLALFGIAAGHGFKGHLLTSSIEHHAILHSCKRLEELGVEVTYLPVDRTGMVSLGDVEDNLRPDTFLISIMYGNNEVGTIQPIEQIGALAKERGMAFHTDAVQAFGMVPIDVSVLPVDLMSLSSHKIQGPAGIGALYCAPSIKLEPLLHGGTQERARRAGTENVAAVIGFAAAAKIALADIPGKAAALNRLRAAMIEELARGLAAEAFTVNGHPERRLPHILNVSFPGVSSESLLMNLDLEGVAASSGSACTSGSLEISHVLQNMRLADVVTQSAIRFSFGPGTREDEVRSAAKKTATIVRRIRTKADRTPGSGGN